MQAFFYRTHDGHEIDLLLRLRGRLYPIEIKLGVTPPSPVRVERCLEQLSLPKGYIVAPAKERLSLSRKVEFLGLDQLMAELRLKPNPQRGRGPA